MQRGRRPSKLWSDWKAIMVSWSRLNNQTNTQKENPLVKSVALVCSYISGLLGYTFGLYGQTLRYYFRGNRTCQVRSRPGLVQGVHGSVVGSRCLQAFRQMSCMWFCSFAQGLIRNVSSRGEGQDISCPLYSLYSRLRSSFDSRTFTLLTCLLAFWSSSI